ncbi:tetratricopeptide repeat protein [Carnobacterium gallinarum]|uniref:tetratricopeptide repeat protein n=1 Tax=Carnobacterium gallinarum TaxID=2749 RepID=UPI000557D1DC|nr:hypothetical protein [Carnobacterium gallinarum]
MGEKIIFPKNYEHYLKKAMNAFQSGRMTEAIPFFKEAYQIKQEEKVNTFYVTALYQTGFYQEAKELAEDKRSFYENEEQLYAFYTSILIRAHYFLQAEAIIKKQLNRKDKQLDRVTWQSLMGFSKEEQKNMQIKEEKRIQDILKRASMIGDKTYQEQSVLLNELETVSIKDYLIIAKLLLVNPYVNGLIKATLLEYLVNEKIDEDLAISWFQQERKVNPSQLLPINKIPTVRLALQLLEEQLGVDNPTLYEVVCQEAQVHFILLYPFIEEVIVEPRTWVSLYRKHYDLNYQDEVENLDEFTKEEEWMDCLNQQIHDFTVEI